MYTWLWMVLVSGIFLGFWDIAKKKALDINSLLKVLAIHSILCFALVSFEYKNAMNVSGQNILILFVKSFIIYFGWSAGFAAIKHLPISIITPFNTLAPLFSIIMGILILNERLGLLETLGICIMLSSYYIIGKVGSLEIFNFFKNKYFYLMAVSAFLGAVSSIIDKVMLKSINTGQMQFWFYLFLAIMYTFSALISRRKNSEQNQALKFDIYMLLMSIFLVVSDKIYFDAMNFPDSQISVIMPLRKISVFVSVIIGGLIFREKNLRAKLGGISLLILGIAMVFMGK